ncbi:MAG: ThiF family adenylyltransferase [Nitrososphaeraceae archaeon]
MAKIEFVIPSVLTKGAGEKKISLEATNLEDAFTKISDQMGEDFKRRVLDLNGKPRSLINIYINGKNMRFSSDGMATVLHENDSIYILPAVAGGSELKTEDLQRYSRQIMLDEIGFVGMEKIRKARVCVVGVGGIGNPVVTQLTAMGVGTIKIVDRDVVEISNLHRQHLYTEDDIGRVKVEAARERLRQINPSVEIEALPISVTRYNAEKIIDGFDIVVDALDSIDARYALNDACIKLNIPLIYAGALGMLGSVCTIIPNESACLRCMFPALAEDDMPTCSTEGVHPSILYLVGGIQVSEVVKIITGENPTLVNKLLYVDLNDLCLEKIQMYRHDECPSCGSKRKLEDSVLRQQLLIEELCGRDRGKRTYTVTPSEVSSPLSLLGVERNAEQLGYKVKTRGKLGLTAISNGSEREQLSVSFMTSGAATIVGAKDQQDALSIYKRFVNGSNI